MPRELFHSASSPVGDADKEDPYRSNSTEGPTVTNVIFASPESQTPTPGLDGDDFGLEDLTRTGSNSSNVAVLTEDDAGAGQPNTRRGRRSGWQVQRYTGSESDQTRKLHPYVQVLSIGDLDSCLALEHAAYPAEHRASRETVRDLPSEVISCHGIFLL